MIVALGVTDDDQDGPTKRFLKITLDPLDVLKIIDGGLLVFDGRYDISNEAKEYVADMVPVLIDFGMPGDTMADLERFAIATRASLSVQEMPRPSADAPAAEPPS